MKVFLEQCLEKYAELAPDAQLHHVDTPFIDEDVGVINPARTAAEGPGLVCPHCAEAFPKKPFREVQNYREAEKHVKKYANM